MKKWTAIIPLNIGGNCKTRLSTVLDLEQRSKLVDDMACGVINALSESKYVLKIQILSPQKPSFDNDWIKDEGRGLNGEIGACFDKEPCLIIHGDLPLVSGEDIDAMLFEAAEAGAAIAPDFEGSGTNALALVAPIGFIPSFGLNSFSLHKRKLPHCAIVNRLGLALDIDTPQDLARYFELSAAEKK